MGRTCPWGICPGGDIAYERCPRSREYCGCVETVRTDKTVLIAESDWLCLDRRSFDPRRRFNAFSHVSSPGDAIHSHALGARPGPSVRFHGTRTRRSNQAIYWSAANTM